MIAVDRDIRRLLATQEITIEPYDPACLQPASYDMHLANQVARWVYRHPTEPVREIDARNPGEYTRHESVQAAGFTITPGEMLLASSVEVFGIAAHLVGQINGKSSLARLGLQVEAAGFFDPGWYGRATLELVNLGRRPIRLYPGMRIAQMVYFTASGTAERPYGHPDLGSKYQRQWRPEPSRTTAVEWQDARM